MFLDNFELFLLALGAMGLGTVMLIHGGNWTIDGAVFIAKKFGVSPLIIGFTIVAFGTSLPELIVSINANLKGAPGIAIGNVLGSNIANILLVCGAAAIVSAMTVKPSHILNDTVMMVASTLLMMGLFVYGIISQVFGVCLVALLVAYILYQYKTSDKETEKEMEAEISESEAEFSNSVLAYVFTVVGLVFIAGGAEFLVRGAQVSAQILNVPDAVIALSLIAFGTSLPELATCVVAALKKHTDLIIGNIIGSNVFNILMILGAAAAIKQIDMSTVTPQIVAVDMWITLAVTVFFSLWLLVFKKVTRPLGMVFVAGYVGYILAIYMIYPQ